MKPEGNFIFVFFNKTAERDRVYDELIKNGLLIRKMEAFGDDKSFRISIGNKEANHRIIDCLSGMK